SLGLLLSMALRFIPRFAEQFKETMAAQQQVSRGAGKSFVGRIKAGVRVFSVMVSRSMENAVDTSDSMKSRGYGLKGRTAFSLFRFYAKDAVLLAVMLTEAAVLSALLLGGKLSFRYYPSVKGAIGGVWAFVFYGIYAALLLTPLLLNIGEDVKWKRLRSKI
ncbi:MAG: energy-coupling factor transporter transmembrane protein EcfT, partial [Ruminococcus sp.]|nr:energy-coupling factor transporter transmembrane protein EcfT [Ruminococcus sp.]